MYFFKMRNGDNPGSVTMLLFIRNLQALSIISIKNQSEDFNDFLNATEHKVLMLQYTRDDSSTPSLHSILFWSLRWTQAFHYS